VCYHGFLGPHPRLVDPGATQSFQLEEEDAGAFYWSIAEREKKKVDVATGRLLRKNKTKKELLSELAYKTPESEKILLSCLRKHRDEPPNDLPDDWCHLRMLT
jgi:hypothetical protein